MRLRFSISYNDRTWKKIREGVEKAARNGTYARAGILDSAENKPHGRITNGELGTVHEFGSANGHIPQRSWCRAPVDANRQKYLAMLAEYFRGVYVAQYKIGDALLMVAREMASDMRAAIRSGIAPSLKRRDGTPLLLTRQLHNAIKGDVVENDTPRSR